MTPQKLMDDAFDNYLGLSAILRDDMLALLQSESDSQHWRRNFVRVSASLIEGFAHCLRQICSVSFHCKAPEITNDESKVLKSESGFEANERIKLTLKAAYKIFEIQPSPNFGGQEWPKAKRVLEIRHQLMHPKTVGDLEISDKHWEELRDGMGWLAEQLFNSIFLLYKKHVG